MAQLALLPLVDNWPLHVLRRRRSEIEKPKMHTRSDKSKEKKNPNLKKSFNNGFQKVKLQKITINKKDP